MSPPELEAPKLDAVLARRRAVVAWERGLTNPQKRHAEVGGGVLCGRPAAPWQRAHRLAEVTCKACLAVLANMAHNAGR